MQVNLARPGLKLERVARAKERNFWSVRVDQDVRIILHRSGGNVVLCYVGRHDDAYEWASRRRLETHPTTGAAQMVEVREVVKEMPVYREVERQAEGRRLLFAGVGDEQLLSYGVPAEWLGDVRAADEDSVLELAGRLPAEAGEALLELAVGGTPQPSLPVPAGGDPFSHPDAMRRFRVMRNVEELSEALEYPWERWTIFLHPAQRGLVERDYGGPARVSGSAGTGKTVVALHRAAFLAKGNPNARILVTTFSDALANLLRSKLELLTHREVRRDERFVVDSVDAVGARLYEEMFGGLKLAGRGDVEGVMGDAAAAEGVGFPLTFLMTEWERVVDAWQLSGWDDYRSVARIGRYRRLSQAQRREVWPVFERARAGLRERGMLTRAEMFGRLTQAVGEREDAGFEFVVVDEAQDVSVAQLRFLAALCGGSRNGLFFAGDLGQRIFQHPFSWKELGVDVRGRSQTLRINYRTSHQIRMQADRLLDPAIADVDGNLEERKGTVSVFNGPKPDIRIFGDADAECAAVSEWVSERMAEGVDAGEISVFVRSECELERAVAAVKGAGVGMHCLRMVVRWMRAA